MPMFAQYARLSLDQVPLERLIVNLKEPDNSDHALFLAKAFNNELT